MTHYNIKGLRVKICFWDDKKDIQIMGKSGCKDSYEEVWNSFFDILKKKVKRK